MLAAIEAIRVPETAHITKARFGPGYWDFTLTPNASKA
jgi:hypothetical protein